MRCRFRYSLYCVIDDAQYKPLILLAVFVTIWVNIRRLFSWNYIGKHRLFDAFRPKNRGRAFLAEHWLHWHRVMFSPLLFLNLACPMVVVFRDNVIFGTFGDLIESLMRYRGGQGFRKCHSGARRFARPFRQHVAGCTCHFYLPELSFQITVLSVRPSSLNACMTL